MCVCVRGGSKKKSCFLPSPDLSEAARVASVGTGQKWGKGREGEKKGKFTDVNLANYVNFFPFSFAYLFLAAAGGGAKQDGMLNAKDGGELGKRCECEKREMKQQAF